MEKPHIRKMTPKDFVFAISLTDTMNWDLTEKDFRFMMSLEPEGCFVALDKNKRIGLITTVSFDRVGWIGNVIVDASVRSKGVGLLLVKHAMDYLAEKKVTTVGLYSYVNTVSFYKKLDFKSDNNFIRLVGQSSSARHDAKCVRNMRESDLQDAIDFDKLCMGWNRERLLKKMFKSSTDLCCVAREGNDLLGFVMADRYRQEIGPLLNRPDQDEEAMLLLRVALGKLAGVEVRIGVSEKRARIIDALMDMGFKEEFKVLRMYWGDWLEDKGCLLTMESLERG